VSLPSIFAHFQKLGVCLLVYFPCRDPTETLSRAIENGSNFLAEGFLFSVATALILGETWRSSRSQSKQRSDVNDSIEELRIQVRELSEHLRTWEETMTEERRRCVNLGPHTTLLTATQKPRTCSHLGSRCRDRASRWRLCRIAG
jgi:Optic atrophy 3 protein (OPA3)